MCHSEKCNILNDLVYPFGYCYVDSQDIFSSLLDAWQREFGYCSLYDETALHFNMVFDCLPVYFDYDGKTWLIEFWKGQYGINTGAEIGVYYADRILDKEEYSHTLFHSVENKDMPELSFHLFRQGSEVADLCHRHWWLTAFSVGRFSAPADLYMRASITFPNRELTQAFLEGLINTGYDEEGIHVCCNTIAFAFTESIMPRNCLQKLHVKFAQAMNRFWCRVYLFITRPFCLSMDKILYLYYYLPFIFRRMLRIRKYKKFKDKRG